MAHSNTGILDLLTFVGEDNVQVQSLKNSVVKVDSNKKHNDYTVSFLTDQMSPADLIVDKPKKTGLVIWLETNKVDEWLQKKTKN